MKIIILAGGFGTRLSEETDLKPKPMVEIGGKPLLWHIMKIYSHYGFNDFVICLGYKGYMIKEWFANYFLHNSDVTIKIKTNIKAVRTNVLTNLFGFNTVEKKIDNRIRSFFSEIFFIFYLQNFIY